MSLKVSIHGQLFRCNRTPGLSLDGIVVSAGARTAVSVNNRSPHQDDIANKQAEAPTLIQNSEGVMVVGSDRKDKLTTIDSTCVLVLSTCSH